jgi:hypothetical protein
MNKALLAVMMQPPVPLEEEFNDWYDTEHLADRVSAPGFESGARYDSVSGGPRSYITLYDLADIGTLTTPEYKLVSGNNFTPWTKRLMRRIPRFRCLAEQIYPGNELIATAPFMTLVRFAGLGSGDRSKIIKGAESLSASAKIVQVRAFGEESESGFNYLLTIASHCRVDDDLNFTGFGSAAAHLDLVRSFVPHKVGWTWEKSI